MMEDQNSENKGPLTLKNWADEDKPREKLSANGKKSLSNAELIAILLGSGCRGMSAVDLAKKLLNNAHNSLSEMSKMEISAFKSLKGMGEAKAITIIAALELGYRMKTESIANNDIYVRESRHIFEYIGPQIIDLSHEEFWAIYFNAKHKILGCQRIASGGLVNTSVDIRLIYKYALEKNATALAVAHNHPSGILEPSNADITTTRKIKLAGETLGIKLLDHLVIGLAPNNQEQFYSFLDHDLL